VPDVDTDILSLVVLLVVGFGAVLVLLGRASSRRRSTDPVVRRRAHATAARKSVTLAMVCVGLLVLALLLGRLLLGGMAGIGLVVFTTLAVVRGRLSR
jgi:uncharacterized membrane protein YiaA